MAGGRNLFRLSGQVMKSVSTPHRFTLSKRASGVLLHPISLPGGDGCGDLGPEAFRFVDFLSRSRQSWWQMLPMTPPALSSPYHALSAFAGNPLFVSLEGLKEEGLLTSQEIPPTSSIEEGRVNYGEAKRHKERCLKSAFIRFKQNRRKPESFEAFCEENRTWLENYALFCGLKELHKGASWSKWEWDLRTRDPKALERAKKRVQGSIDYHEFVQYEFFRQWRHLKEYCLQKGIALLGDIPIFVAHDSADVWSLQEFFWLDPEGNPSVVAGVPPDYFARTGQRWGNPLYRWDRMRESGYDWWIKRFRAIFEQFDAARLDHFIGFHRVWEIPAEEQTALHGRWVEGPGENFFEKVFQTLGPLELVAEDLGLVTPEVKTLRDRFNFPGLRVLQFAFGGEGKKNEHLPHHYPKRCVVYTGTHDNDTVVGWFNDSGSGASRRSKREIQKEKEFALHYLKSNGPSEIHWELIRLAMESVADIAIFPIQDILGLGREARMNLPGTVAGNWEWRLKKGGLNDSLAKRLRELTEKSGR